MILGYKSLWHPVDSVIQNYETIVSESGLRSVYSRAHQIGDTQYSGANLLFLVGCVDFSIAIISISLLCHGFELF